MTCDAAGTFTVARADAYEMAAYARIRPELALLLRDAPHEAEDVDRVLLPPELEAREFDPLGWFAALREGIRLRFRRAIQLEGGAVVQVNELATVKGIGQLPEGSTLTRDGRGTRSLVIEVDPFGEDGDGLDRTAFRRSGRRIVYGCPAPGIRFIDEAPLDFELAEDPLDPVEGVDLRQILVEFAGGFFEVEIRTIAGSEGSAATSFPRVNRARRADGTDLPKFVAQAVTESRLDEWHSAIVAELHRVAPHLAGPKS